MLELEKKVKALEQTITQLSGKADTGGKQLYDEHVSPLASEGESMPQSSRQHGFNYAAAEESTVDGLATVSPLPSKLDTSISYGGASTIAFLRNLSSLVDGPGTLHKQVPVAHQRLIWPLKARLAKTTDQINPAFLVLPPRRMADNFVESYFGIVHPLYPILHQPTFMRSYQALWHVDASRTTKIEPEPIESTLFWSTMNLVFALGCQFSNSVDPSNRSSLAADFYERSQRISYTEYIDTSSIDEVQALLLTTVYLQSTHQASRCWNVLGLAIRAAQALGMHLEQAYQVCTSQYEREVGRRIWYNCVILDKMQSMTFGRPAMLAASQVRLPEAIDDEYLQTSNEGIQPQNYNSRLAFFILSVALFDILSDVLSIVYHESPLQDRSSTTREAINSSSTRLHETMQLSARLDKFESEIPAFLRIKASSSEALNPSSQVSTPDIFTLQANVLHCRTLYTRLVLLRPLLLAACSETHSGQRGSNPDTNSFESHVVARACALCTQTAVALIDSLHATINSVLRNSVWYTVYFTFSAAVVLITARIYTIRVGHGSLFGDNAISPQVGFEVAWSKAMSILAFHKDRIHSAGRAIIVLESLNQKLEHETSQQQRSATAGPSEGHYPSIDLDQETLGWTENFNIFDLSNAWLMQEVINLDNLELTL